MIRQGRVALNGQTVFDPAVSADPERDHVRVDGKLLRTQPLVKTYYLFNKPRNVVSTFEDPQGRVCLGDLIKPIRKGLFSVGRLDFDAEGLMILTNDGELAQKLSHPSHAVPRTYLVKVKGVPEDKELGKIRKGMSIGDGQRVGDIKWQVLSSQKTTTWMRIILFEGRKNEIKRIFDRVGHPVRKIRRIGFGGLSLGRLPVGAWRPLTQDEIAKLTSVGVRTKS